MATDTVWRLREAKFGYLAGQIRIDNSFIQEGEVQCALFAIEIWVWVRWEVSLPW